MFSRDLSRRRDKKVSCETRQYQSLILQGHQLQNNNQHAQITSHSYICSCKCKCPQCCGKLVEEVKLRLKEMQDRYEASEGLDTAQVNSALDEEKGNTKSCDTNEKVKHLEQIIKEQEVSLAMAEQTSRENDELLSKIKELESLMQQKEDEYKDKFVRLQEKVDIDIKRCHDNFDKQLEKVESEHQQKFVDLVVEHEQELKVKDSFIAMLKADIANSFDVNARERKSQIDELLKQLQRKTMEAEIAEAALHELQLQRKEKEVCRKCEMLQRQIEDLQGRLEARNSSIEDLSAICSKMKAQLVYQGEINDLIRKSKDWKT